MNRARIIYCILALTAFVLIRCNKPSGKNIFLNIDNPEAHYTGQEACKDCHKEIYETYIHTGMGMSWYKPSSPNNKIDFSHAHVYDAIKNLHYYCYQKDSQIVIVEYRLQENDTVHKRIELADYIVGSGQHTYSFIINHNGYLSEAPISYFSQSKKWDLSPGYENGQNSRFDRPIEAECMTCHNAYPNQDTQAFNKYQNIPLGINCERCHGPGSLHIDKIKSGDYEHADTAIDYTIVNPKHLSVEQQNNLCQRCHLNGLAVLNDGKTFYDHQPAKLMHQTFNVFVPKISGGSGEMIMVSHVERMMQSKCFTVSNKMSCISCHDPHVSYLSTPISKFNAACKTCHQSNSALCTETSARRNAKQDNCSGCHMKKNGSVDIPHVSITDHMIVKNIDAPTPKKEDTKLQFQGLTCYSKMNVESVYRARAFMDYYEKIKQNEILLDSAQKFLNENKAGLSMHNKDVIRLYYLQKNYSKVTSIANSMPSAPVDDIWTAYRIAQSYAELGNTAEQIKYLEKAVKIKPLALDFQLHLANAYIASGKLKEAEKTLRLIISQNPNHELANSALATLCLNSARLAEALPYLQKTLYLNPDNVQNLINTAVYYYQQADFKQASIFLRRAASLEPNNQKIKLMLADLKSRQ